MAERLEVIYENGVLHPVGSLPSFVQEHQHLTITVESPDDSGPWLADADDSISLEAVRSALSKTTKTLSSLASIERDER